MVFNVSKYPGLKADQQGYGSTANTFVITPRPLFPSAAMANVQGNLFTYLFGPQIKVRSPKVQPIVHLLFGGADSNLYVNAFETICTTRIGACAFSAATAMPCDGIWRWHRYSGGSCYVHSTRVDYLLTDFGSTTPIRTVFVIRRKSTSTSGAIEISLADLKWSPVFGPS